VSLEPFKIVPDLLQTAAELLVLLPAEPALRVLARDPAHQHPGQVQVAQ
jgi:hypothetical protein